MAGSQVDLRQSPSQPRRLPALNAAQIAASNPAEQVWLSAPPGTGERLVVAARIWRLLLAGVDPDTILCLSLNPAEAVAVSNKVIHQLSRWVRANDGEIAADLQAIGEDYSPATRTRARYLFARVLDCPGGISIQSFQDFALQLLANSPFEAGRIPGLRVLDIREQADLSRLVFADLQAKARRDRRSELLDAIGALIDRLGLRNAEYFLQECACQRDAIADLPPMIGRWLRSAMDLERGELDLSFAHFMEQALETGREYTHLYTEAKRRLGACDAQDLLAEALSVTEHPVTGEWTRFKLDQRTDHLLVTDAQNTNWRHWRLVRAITDDFFAGEGASASVRTLFVSGDAQAAISGANPIYYEAAFEHFYRLGNDVGGGYEFDGTGARDFRLLTLIRSYRSAQALVEFTSTVMSMLPEPGTGILGEQAQLTTGVHLPGEVILVSRASHEHLSNNGSDASDTIGAHAERIVRLIKGWLESEDMLASTGSHPKPENIAIFFKKRGRLALEVVSRLRTTGIAFADEPGLGHNESSVMSDLLATARFAMNHGDENALSLLMKSPLIDQPEGTPTASIDQRGLIPPEMSAILDELVCLANRATPHRFFESVLSGPLDGRRKLVSRYGAAALDEIDAILGDVLDFERSNPPCLQAFLDRFERSERYPGTVPWRTGSAVRILDAETVRRRHFPIVILADASEYEIAREPRFRACRFENGDLEIPIIFPDADEVSDALGSHLTDAKRRAVEEDWRLFYILTTSAADRLVIAGPEPAGHEDEGGMSWYSVSADAFDALGVPGRRGEDRIFQGIDARGFRPAGSGR